MAEPVPGPVCGVAIRDGTGCRDVPAMADARHLRHAVRRLALVAAAMRGWDVVGVPILTEAENGPVVATRHVVWP